MADHTPTVPNAKAKFKQDILTPWLNSQTTINALATGTTTGDLFTLTLTKTQMKAVVDTVVTDLQSVTRLR